MSEPLKPGRWSLATRIAFRFFFCYYALNFLPSLIFRNEFLAGKYSSFWDAVVLLANEAVFHLPYDVMDVAGNDSYAWVRFFCTLAFAGA
ncbi:MAG TPA: hypothetical protein VGK43_06290, partial [Solirubrobacterales bacterium]